MNAINVKDRLWSMVNDAADVHEAVKVCETILATLMLTDGLWCECSYAYKGVDLADLIIKKMDSYDSICAHHKTHEMLRRVWEDAYRVRKHFYELHHQPELAI